MTFAAASHTPHPPTVARRRALLAAVVALMLACVAVLPAAAQERPTPASRARAAIVVDAETGAVLFERNARTPFAPASLTKMATALVAVERAPLDKPVRPSHAYNVTPVVIGLEPGDSLALGDALYGLMLNSGNDAALAIAETAADGSTERFVGWMNDLARRLGLQHTTFKNPHGLDQDGHLSSAYDMAIIGRALMRQPVLKDVVGQGRHVVEGPPRWVFRNTNPLFGAYAGVDGIKTGFDDNAGRCLVATAERDGRRAIAVVMNSPAYGDEAASLLDYAFEDRHWGRRSADGDGRAAPLTPQGPSSPRVSMLRADLGVDGAPASLTQAGRLAQTGAVSRIAP